MTEQLSLFQPAPPSAIPAPAGPTLPTLSLWQPWASLIAAGVKMHETRHWPTRVRGRVAIHAAKRLDLDDAPDRLCAFALGAGWDRGELPHGAVVAIAELTACMRTEEVADRVERADFEAGNFGPGRFAFRLCDVRPLLQPIPLVGRQGFFGWQPPIDLEQRLGPVLDQLKPALRYEQLPAARQERLLA